VSTARGGEPSAFEPGLEHLIGALTASGHPHELAGRDAARAAFSAASRPPTTAKSTRFAWARSVLARSTRTRSARSRPIRLALPARLAVSLAAVIAVLGGLTAAAAAQALPAQVQQIAYNVLSPLGVPVSQPTHSHHSQSASPGQPLPATGPAAGQGGCPCASASSQSTGTGTQPHPTHKPKAMAKAKAKKLKAKPVLRLVPGRLKDRLTVAAGSGKPGDIVNLTESTGGAWKTVASAPLGPKRRAVFILPVTTAAGHLFKAEVLEGASHAPVASNRLWIPRPAKTGAKAIQPAPSTSPTGTGSPTPTPTPTPALTATTTPVTASPTTTLTGTTSPSGTTSPTGTGSPTPTPSTDPSASATAPSTSAPPQTPEPSTRARTSRSRRHFSAIHSSRTL
jgi:hypothetical protein